MCRGTMGVKQKKKGIIESCGIELWDMTPNDIKKCQFGYVEVVWLPSPTVQGNRCPTVEVVRLSSVSQPLSSSKDCGGLEHTLGRMVRDCWIFTNNFMGGHYWRISSKNLLNNDVCENGHIYLFHCTIAEKSSHLYCFRPVPLKLLVRRYLFSFNY